jgi:DNA-binding NtrC family response regulator
VARILLVEDDVDVRPLLEHILVSGQHHVAIADDVATAMTLIDAELFDLVISDINLPDGNGLTIADTAAAKGIKTLLLTGYGLSLSGATLAKYDYLLKPVRIAEFLAAVEQRIAGSVEANRNADPT